MDIKFILLTLAFVAVAESELQPGEVIARMRNAKTELCAAQSQMLDVMTQMSEKLSQLENKTHPCLISYRGKCYWFEYTGVYCDGIAAVCAARGGKPANIYDGVHYHLLHQHLRLSTYYTGHSAMWTGLRYKQATNSMTLSDGTTPAPYVKWIQGWPVQGRCCCIHMEARLDGSSAFQHLGNNNPNERNLGVICEEN